MTIYSDSGWNKRRKETYFATTEHLEYEVAQEAACMTRNLRSHSWHFAFFLILHKKLRVLLMLSSILVFSGLQHLSYYIEEMSPVTTQLNFLPFLSFNDFSHWVAECFKTDSCACPTSYYIQVMSCGNTALTACHVMLSTPSASWISQLFTQKRCLPPVLWGGGEPHVTE